MPVSRTAFSGDAMAEATIKALNRNEEEKRNDRRSRNRRSPRLAGSACSMISGRSTADTVYFTVALELAGFPAASSR